MATIIPSIALGQGLQPAPVPANTAPQDLPTVIMNIINYILGLVGIIALAYFIYGGFRYITAGGNEDTIAEAKRILSSSIIGIIIIGVAAAVVNFVIGAITGNIGTGGTI